MKLEKEDDTIKMLRQYVLPITANKVEPQQSFDPKQSATDRMEIHVKCRCGGGVNVNIVMVDFGNR